MKTFNPKSKDPDRAPLQAWMILIGAAMQRRTLTYEGLSVLMYRKRAQGVLDRILGHIALYCIANGLPHLTSIVVGKRRGTPGADIPMNLKESDMQRERVYQQDWYDVYPPTTEQLGAAYSGAGGSEN